MRQTRYSSCNNQSTTIFCNGERRRQGRQRAGCGQGLGEGMFKRRGFYLRSQGIKGWQQVGGWLRGLCSPNVKRSE